MAVLLLTLGACVAAYDVPPIVGRRAVLSAAAAAISVALPPAATAMSDDEWRGIIDRAKYGQLQTDNVLKRAARDQLVDATAFKKHCESVDPVLSIDKAALKLEQAEVDHLRGVMKTMDDASADHGRYKAKLADVEQITSRLEATVKELGKVRSTCSEGATMTIADAEWPALMF